MSKDIKTKNISADLPSHKIESVLPNYDKGSEGCKILTETPYAELPEEFLEASHFKRIEANHYPFNHYRVHSLLQLLKKAQRLELSLQEQKLATFFVADNSEREVYGGAVLLKKRIRNYHKNRSSKFSFQGERLFSASFVLHLANKDPFYMSGKRITFCRHFYEELYRTFFVLGQKQSAPYMWVTLDPEEALCLETLSNFPFMLRMKPKDTIDGLFHGLLALKKDIAKTLIDPKRWIRNPFPQEEQE
jgi:hypothetical protein